MRTHLATLLAALLVGSAVLVARAAPTGDPVLRPLPLREGVRDVLNPGDDPKKLGERDVYKVATRAGVDLAAPAADPVVAHSFDGERLFYVFYKTMEEAFGDRPYVIQRIKRTERTWARAGAEPEESVTYQVEAFKLLAGAQKRGDQHHGSYALRELHRREIVKEYEIGFGEVPGQAEGDAWPFDPGVLFQYVQKYGPAREVYDSVNFHRSSHWTLSVACDATGEWHVRAPELGIDLPARPTPVDATLPASHAPSADLVLVRGVGLQGAGDASEVVAALSPLAGDVVEDVPAGTANRNVSFVNRVTANIRADGSLNTLRTRPGFAGRTAEGVAIGDSRARVMEVYGAPRRQYTDAAWWTYGDIGFWFDGHGNVARMYVRRR